MEYVTLTYYRTWEELMQCITVSNWQTWKQLLLVYITEIEKSTSLVLHKDQWVIQINTWGFKLYAVGCVLARDSFATGMDWLLDRTVESCSIGVAFGQSSFTDLDFADDVSVLAELLELLVPILETIASEAASLGVQVNWQKTKVQPLGCK